MFALVAWAIPLAAVSAPDANGFDWADITSPGNAAYPGNQFGLNAGRGSVAYSYRMSKYELTTGQWLEFYNTFSTQSDLLNQKMVSGTGLWGVVSDPWYPFSAPGSRMILNPNIPNASRVGVHGVSWRLAAIYCNWLHHDKSSNWETIQSGAYDARTFGTGPGGKLVDQVTRSPGAKFWIPSLDEWLKAVYFDPTKDGKGGWWNQPTGSNAELVPGFPGVGQTSATLGGDAIWIPVGSYPEIKTPWGLLDASGGVSEWTEEIHPDGFDRLSGGTSAMNGSMRFDDAGFQLPWPPSIDGPGLRIASEIPSPGGAIFVAIAGFYWSNRTRNSK